MYTHTYIHTFIYIRTYICTHIRTYTFIYTYTYLHTYVHTYIHRYVHIHYIHVHVAGELSDRENKLQVEYANIPHTPKTDDMYNVVKPKTNYHFK